MDKFELLSQVKILVQSGQLTQKELLQIYQEASLDGNSLTVKHQSRLSAILYFIGGIVIFLGISIFIGQNWHQLNDLSRILVTLGIAIAAYVMGALFSQYEKLNLMAQSFYFVSGLILPLGLHVTLDILDFKVYQMGVQSFMAAFSLAVFGCSYVLFRREIFLIFTIIFGSWLYFAMTGLMTEGVYTDWRAMLYRWMAAGVAYMFLGYYYSQQDKPSLVTVSQWLNGIGVFTFLGTTLALGGWKPSQSMFWELTFPLLTFGIIFLSVYFKNKSYLVFGTLYLMAYILKISSEYFAHSFGWALSLVIAGFALMGTGYLAVYVNKKYVSK